MTPLLWASYQGHQSVVQLLLAHHADVNAGDEVITVTSVPLLFTSLYQVPSSVNYVLNIHGLGSLVSSYEGGYHYSYMYNV